MSPRVQAVLIGGAFTGVLSALPFVSLANVCCVWLIGGGVVAAWLLQQSQPAPLTPGEGAAAGCLAGIVGAFISLPLSVPLQFLQPRRPVPRDMLTDANMPPEIASFVAAIFESPLRVALLGFAAMLVAGLIFSTLGGLLGAVFFSPGRTAAAPPTAPPPDASPPALPPAAQE